MNIRRLLEIIDEVQFEIMEAEGRWETESLVKRTGGIIALKELLIKVQQDQVQELPEKRKKWIFGKRRR